MWPPLFPFEAQELEPYFLKVSIATAVNGRYRSQFRALCITDFKVPPHISLKLIPLKDTETKNNRANKDLGDESVTECEKSCIYRQKIVFGQAHQELS